MSGQVGKIKCKHCACTWNNVKDYLASDGCSKEECPMGKRWKARQEANRAIEAAQKSAAKEDKYVCHVRTCHMESEVVEDQAVRERPMSHCIAFHVMKQ